VTLTLQAAERAGVRHGRTNAAPMTTVQARRTLVKSAPELWVELSDADSLGRRLESLGDIRITRVEPQTTVSWEGERARGTVTIEPAGFGTRVTLTAESSQPAPPPRAPETPPPAPRDRPAPPASEPPSAATAQPPSLPAPEPSRPPTTESKTPPAWSSSTLAERQPAAPVAPPEPRPSPSPAEPAEPRREPPVRTTATLEPGLELPAQSPSSRRATGRSWLLRRLARGRRWGAGPQAAEPHSKDAAPDPTSVGAQMPEPSVAEPRLPEPPPLLDAPRPASAPQVQAGTPEPTGLEHGHVAGQPVAEDALAEEGDGGHPGVGDREPPPGDHEPDSGDGQADERDSGLDAEALDALLAGVLDDLGAAHHRPFSRG
jgi:hypothetical protein